MLAVLLVPSHACSLADVSAMSSELIDAVVYPVPAVVIDIAVIALPDTVTLTSPLEPSP